jgi:putative ABC transport system permease protein
MLRNYFLVAIRNLYRNKYYALINIVGLGMAMALCVVGYVNYQFSRSFNAGLRNVDRICAIASYYERDGGRGEIIQHPTPLAPAIAVDVPGVENYCRLAVFMGDVRSGDRVFNEGLWFVDTAFFDMFTFAPKQGSLETFKTDPSGVIITDDLAAKYFGDEQAVGRQLSITMYNGTVVDFTVLGVIVEPSVNSSFYSGVYIAYSRQRDIFGFNLESWTDWTSASFLMLDSVTSIDQVSASLAGYVTRSNDANPQNRRDGFFLTPMREFPALAQEIGSPLRQGMHPAAIAAPSAVAILILLLACFNFMNTSVAFAARRFREIGVRKVVGCMRGQLVWQFLGENLLLCLFALALAAALAEILVPAYASLWPELDLSFSYTDSPGLIGFLLAMLLFTGIAAGLYPALYVSRFSPTAIFRGRQKLGGTNALVRVLLTLQLALSMACIVAAVIMTRNATYIRDFNYGYDIANTLVVPIEGSGQYQVLRDALADYPDVVSVGATQHLMARNWATFGITVDGRELNVNSYRVGDRYFDALHLNIIQGRSFDSSLASDIDQTVIVSRNLVAQAGWDNPLEKTVEIKINDANREFRVIGVVDDFYPNGLRAQLLPAIIRLATPDQYQFAIIRVKPGSGRSVNSYVEDIWHQKYPSLAYEGFWHDQQSQQEYETNDNLRWIFLFVAAVAVVISTMGLLALVSLNLARRTREIGIRKALGASMTNIGVLVTREFVILIMIGSVLSVGLGYYLTDILLASVWDFYCDFGVWPFVLSVLIIVCVAGLSVGYRVVAAARSNPVDALRCE